MPAAKPQPRGPAADPKWPPSLAEGNPYNFTPQLLAAARPEPKITDTHIFFFGYEGHNPCNVFQQWFPSVFVAPRNPYRANAPGSQEQVEFPTSEHFMMYHKALLMGDQEVAGKILAPENAHPSRAKALGREVKNFDLEIWKNEADRVVEEANLRKFGQNEDLKEVLLGTGEKVIVEASPDDKIWGIGFDIAHAEGNESLWGNNGLGKALMKVRQRLRDGENGQ